MIETLQGALSRLQPTLLAKGVEADEMLARVSAERENAAAQRASVEEESDAVSKRTVEVQRLADEAQADLDRHRARGMCASCARQVVLVACIVHASFMEPFGHSVGC